MGDTARSGVAFKSRLADRNAALSGAAGGASFADVGAVRDSQVGRPASSLARVLPNGAWR